MKSSMLTNVDYSYLENILSIKLNDNLSELFCSISSFIDQVLTLLVLKGSLDSRIISGTLPFINFILGRLLGVFLKISKAQR